MFCENLEFKDEIYEIQDDSNKRSHYKLSEKLYYVHRTKRKVKKTEIKCQNLLDLRSKIENYLKDLKEKVKFPSFTIDEIERQKSDNIEFINTFSETQNFQFLDFFGENSSEIGIIHQLNNHKYLIPRKSRFFNKDIRYLSNYLDEEKFDFLVIDPPWNNRYIKRVSASVKQSYPTLDNTDIANIPLENHIKTESLVLIWCTNSETHATELVNNFIPKWGLKLMAVWYWVKIDMSGNILCPFADKNMKQPFEKIFICSHKDNESYLGKIKDENFIFSVPSTIHSQKPFLYPIFSHLLLENPKCLELFARSLHENFSSFGTEVLKLQNVSLFEEIKDFSN